ncbi:YqhA family protein [Aestuariispira insulae]|uniref:Uncharacterized protein UPF0114 n=1 Tax=Aestuariispira insulae TaxID=1461337 RepID=A0A3D9HXT2_9PROT|nr:YqhA family protein [Aestuariispira insulae]RED54312.1 uncharacterized protein UPF0114 [Aestuariispira insulae]
MKHILKLRYLSLLASICSFAGSAFLFYLGAFKTYKAISNFFHQTPPPEHFSHLADGERALVGIVEAVDTFLFALVLLIFAVGIIRIFILEPDAEEEHNGAKPWWHVGNTTELKATLLEIIVVMLAVIFLKVILIDQINWELLVIPIGAAILAGVYWIFRKAGH